MTAGIASGPSCQATMTRDYFWIKENGDLVIHTSGAAMPAGIYNNPGDYCEVTDVYFDWTSGADGKYNTARIMASAANDFYNK